MDSILDILQCKLCFSQFTDPVSLPCGDSICEEHTKELREAEWKCPLCDGVHVLADGERYPVNKALVAMLKTNISKFDLGPIHKKAKEEVEAAEATQRGLMRAIREPKDFLATFTPNYRNQVDLTREETITRFTRIVDEACDSMKAEIVQYEAESEKRLRADAAIMNELAKDLQSKMTVWKKNLDELVVNEPLWTKIAQEAKSMQEQIDERINKALVIPPVLKQMRTHIQTKALIEISDKLEISPKDEKYVLVRDVSKIAKAQSWGSLRSKTFDFRGFKFCLSVQFKLEDNIMHLGAYVTSQSDHQKQTFKTQWKTFIFGKDFQIIKKYVPGPGADFSQKHKSWGIPNIMSLNDIMAHPAYDPQEDMVRVEVVIKNETFLIKNLE